MDLAPWTGLPDHDCASNWRESAEHGHVGTLVWNEHRDGTSSHEEHEDPGAGSSEQKDSAEVFILWIMSEMFSKHTAGDEGLGMGTYTEGRDNNGTETSNGTVREVGQKGDGNEEPGLWVLERLHDLCGLDRLVLNTGLLVTHALDSNNSLFWVQEVGGHWAVWKEEPHGDTPNAGSSTDDHELVLPWRQITLNLANGVKEEGSNERAHSDGRVPDSVT